MLLLRPFLFYSDCGRKRGQGRGAIILSFRCCTWDPLTARCTAARLPAQINTACIVVCILGAFGHVGWRDGPCSAALTSHMAAARKIAPIMRHANQKALLSIIHSPSLRLPPFFTSVGALSANRVQPPAGSHDTRSPRF